MRLPDSDPVGKTSNESGPVPPVKLFMLENVRDLVGIARVPPPSESIVQELIPEVNAGPVSVSAPGPPAIAGTSV